MEKFTKKVAPGKKDHKNARDELRPFFWSHARTPHTQIHYRTHTCAHIDFEVVAHRTRTPHLHPQFQFEFNLNL